MQQSYVVGPSTYVCMEQCNQCGYRMLTKGLRYANNGNYEISIDCCADCGEPLEEVPDGYELDPNHIT